MALFANEGINTPSLCRGTFVKIKWLRIEKKDSLFIEFDLSVYKDEESKNLKAVPLEIKRYSLNMNEIPIEYTIFKNFRLASIFLIDNLLVKLSYKFEDCHL